MKHIRAISILLLLTLTGNSQSQDNYRAIGNLRYSLISSVKNQFQSIVFEGNLPDEEDSNEIDGSDCLILNPAPLVNSFQQRVKKTTGILSFTFQVHINNFLIDLPPPSFVE